MRCGGGCMIDKPCSGFKAMKIWKDDDFDPWRGGIDAKIDAIIALQLTLADEADTIAADLVEIGEKQDTLSLAIYGAESEIASMRRDLVSRKDALDYFKANAVLTAEGKNQKERDAHVTVTLQDNDEYRTARSGYQDVERTKMLEEAKLGELEREYKRNQAQVYIIKERLAVLAARIKGE